MCKWRHTWDASEQLSIQLGVDCMYPYKAMRDSLHPWAGVKLLQDPLRPNDGWAVEVTTDMAVLQCPTVDLAAPFISFFRRCGRHSSSEHTKDLSVAMSCDNDTTKKENCISGTRRKITVPVNARIGTDFFHGNAPHIEIGIKNTSVIFGMLMCSLALQKPMAIHVKRKEIGLGSYQVSCCPGGSLKPGVEVDGRLKRQGWQLLVDLDDFIPVFRTSTALNSASSPSCCCSSASSTPGA